MNVDRNSEVIPQNGDITLTDIIIFFQRHGKKVLAGSFVGGLVSLLVIAFTPPMYQASWQLQLAMLGTNSISLGKVESAENLIYRLRIAGVYPQDLLQTCLPEERNGAAESLVSALTFKVAKNVENIVEMSLKAASRERAEKCAEGIVRMVRMQQQDLIDVRLKGHQALLARYQQDLRDELRSLDKLKNAEIGNFAYLARLDRLRMLNSNIADLTEEADLSKLYPTKLVGPIYISNKPVSPKIGLTLLLGGALGGFVALLYILITARLKTR